MEFSRQEYWSGFPCPPPRDLPNPGIKPESPVLQADSLRSEPLGKPKVDRQRKCKSKVKLAQNRAGQVVQIKGDRITSVLPVSGGFPTIPPGKLSSFLQALERLLHSQR